jgi:L-threonylcarbamoyladenylate synthase
LIRIFVDPGRPDAAALEQAVAVLRGGGVVAVPTDTLYGLAADPFNPDAVERVFALKGRAPDRPLPLVAADTVQVHQWIGRLSPLAARLAERFWPGPLTLVVAAPEALAPGVIGAPGTVGVRVPAHAVTRAICSAFGRPVTATSANASGEPATASPDVVAAELGGYVDLLVDAGPAPGGEPSTIVDTAGAEPRLIRAGAIPWNSVEACLRGA